MASELKRQRRFYRTVDRGNRKGNSQVLRFLEAIRSISPEAHGRLTKAMEEVRTLGMRVDAVRHLRGDIYEIRVRGDHVSYRLLFSAEGRYRQVLLSLVLIEKKSQKTPAQAINLAEDRWKDWRARGSSKLTRTNGKRDV